MWRKSKMDKTLDTKEQAFLKEHVEIVKNQKKPVNRIWKAWWIRTSNRWKSTKTNLKRRKLPYLKSSMIQPNTQQVRCNQSFFLINKGLNRVMTIKNCWNKVMVMLWTYQKYNANMPIWRNSLRMLHWILHQNNKKINAVFKTLHQRLLQGQKSFVDLTQQNSYMMLVETFHQQTAGAVATLMKEIPPQPLEDGSTFYWDFVLKNKHKIYFMQRK